MKEIFIKYNPYKLETDIVVVGSQIKLNSSLNVGDKRLQEWIEDLPQILVNEFNTKSFKIKFRGTILDYEDLVSVCKEVEKKGISIECEHLLAEESKNKENNKEQYIKSIFKEIQNGPFNELKQDDIKHAFNTALSSEFEVDVVATMSAGKSTLINALLRRKLMPAKQEACTATITRIKDKDLKSFRSTAYDTRGELIGVYPNLDYDTMNKLNNNKDISTIEVEGDIPFVDSSDNSLVLVDTPGPNNSRDPEHKNTTNRMLSKSSKALIIYILNATQIGVNDDNELLNYISESMKVGGKQSKDRFIFVINKLDTFKQGEDSVENTIKIVRNYLESKGIKNPNIFPAAALSALDIRTTLKDVDISKINPWDPTIDINIKEGISGVQKLIWNEELHLENYSNLTPSTRRNIDLMLAEAKKNNDLCTQALIHTGIIPIELAIKLYIEKYARTSKIKNIVDTFAKKLESAKSFESTKQEIARNQSKKEEILKQIDIIQCKLKSVDEAEIFKEKINSIDYTTAIESAADDIIFEAQNKIEEQCSKIKLKLTIDEAKSICKDFYTFSEMIRSQVQLQLEESINKNIKENVNNLLEEYKKKILNLAEEIEIGNVNIDPYELLNGDIENMINIVDLVSNIAKVEEVKVGEEWIKNTNIKWYKPWTWFEEDGYFKDIYENKKYIEGPKLAKRFFAPIQKELYDEHDSTIKYAKEQSKCIRKQFTEKFNKLDEKLKRELEELEKCARDRNDIEKILNESEKRLNWLENIQSKIESILEI